MGGYVTVMSSDIQHQHRDKNDPQKYIHNRPGFGKSCIPCCFKQQREPEDIDVPEIPKFDENDPVQKKAAALIMKERTKLIKKREDLSRKNGKITHIEPKCLTSSTKSKKSENSDMSENDITEDAQLDSEPVKGMEYVSAASENTVSTSTSDEFGEVGNDIVFNKSMNNYIKQADKIPLEKQQWGKLSNVVRTFLKLQKKDVSFLRFGVENHRDQSFIASISAIYAFYMLPAGDHDYNKVMKSILSIKKFKQVILDNLIIDDFAKMQNGDLNIMFFNQSKHPVSAKVIQKYKNSMLYDENSTGFNRLVNSFEEYKKFITSNTSSIHYYHLWDVVKQVVFDNNCNIIMIEQEPSGNIHLLCPPNHYDDQFERFSLRKPSILLMKNGPFFEPIVYYNRHQQKDVFRYIHLLNEESSNLNTFLTNISHLYRNHAFCGVQPSTKDDTKPYKYIYNTSEFIYNILNSNNIDVKEQVMNHNFQNIGFIVTVRNLLFYLPTYPSRFLDELEFVYRNDTNFDKYIQDYATTKSILEDISTQSSREIPCKVSKKVVQNNKIIGLYTITDDYLSVNPSVNVIDDIDVLNLNTNEMNHAEINDFVASNNALTFIENDMQYLYKNQGYYNKFKLFMLKQLMGPKYREQLNSIHLIVNSEHNSRDDKISKLENILKEIGTSISFVEDETLIETENEMKIPKYHLLNKTSNETFFYKRLVDEFIRYPQLHVFLKIPRQYIDDSPVHYNLGKNEILSYESLILSDVLGQVPYELKLYNDNFNLANPRKSILYRNDVFDDKILENVVKKGVVYTNV
jgi:hypothetical protein